MTILNSGIELAQNVQQCYDSVCNHQLAARVTELGGVTRTRTVVIYNYVVL